MSNPPRAPAINQEQLVALCDEMAALARAGVPLEKGLVALGGDLPGRLGKFAEAVGRRLEQGQSLDAVLDEQQHSVPPAFRAVIAAGIRSGRLSAALEGMAGTLRRAAELHRLAIVSMIYPLFVLSLAYVLFAFTAGGWATLVLPAYRLVPCRRRRRPFQFRLRSLLLAISLLAPILALIRAGLLDVRQLTLGAASCLVLIAIALLIRMIVTDVFGDRSGALAARRQNRAVEQPKVPAPAASASRPGEKESDVDPKRREHKKWWNRVWPNRYRPYGYGRTYDVPENR